MKEKKVGYTFLLDREDGTSVQITLPHDEHSLPELLEAFEFFLKGCGFYVPGTLSAIEEEVELKNNEEEEYVPVSGAV